jgi:predicted metal-dependent phosphotriesterase family hydrolase
MSAIETTSRSLMTVSGPIPVDAMGFTLPHEHIMSTFGMDPSWEAVYPEDAVVEAALPYLEKLRNLGCRTILDCTTAYFGRHPALLQRISQESGMQIVTNTGYYAAANQRYVPQHAYTESAAQIADRWVSEFSAGIGDTGICPGFIKTAVGDGLLLEIERKLIEAAILAHKQTGLTIQTHLGDNLRAAHEILDLIIEGSAHPSAWVWVHAHSMPDAAPLLEAAREGAWISFDGIMGENAHDILERLAVFKQYGLLNRVLLSHDGDTYNQGNFRPYEYILTDFTRQCLEAGFTPLEIERLSVQNPAEAFAIELKNSTERT